jgi:hypothetical protein
MNAQLMRPPGEGPELEPGEPSRTAEHPKPRRGGPPRGIRLHPPAAFRRAPRQGHLDQPVLRHGSAFDESPIGLLDAPGREQRVEIAQGLRMPAQDEAARCVLVQPMRQLRQPRQTEAQRIEQCGQVRATLGAGMHGKPRRLVEDEHHGVAVEETARQIDRHAFVLSPSGALR